MLKGSEGFVNIDLDGQMCEIRAKVTSLSGYSGYMDQEDLVRFALGSQVPARHVVLVHGSYRAKRVLARAIRRAHERLGGAGHNCATKDC